MISDFAYLNAVFMFDKVMEGFALKNANKSLVGKEFKLAAVCLYLTAKFEDPKYPYFKSYKNLLISET
jgi:hypothetical protein